MDQILKFPPQIALAPKTRYPFDQMVVGDALFFDSYRQAESARVAASYFVKTKKPDWKFSTRKHSSGWWVCRVLLAS